MFLQKLRRRGAPLAVLSFATFVGTLLPAVPAHAQSVSSDPTDVTPPAHGIGGSSTLGHPSPAAGSSDALISADPSTGVATSSLTFELPRARGDAQPSLSLSYHSNAGVGAAGVGWSLNVPSIERKNDSGFPHFVDGTPGKPSSNPSLDPDDFVFNGQSLVPICVISSTGTCTGDNSRNTPASFAGYTYFRTEIDSFVRFFLSPDRTEWVAQYESGVQMLFGQAFGDSSALETHDVSVSTNANTTTYRWNLSAVVDPVGNKVLYRWAALDPTTASEQPTAPTGTGLKYLTDIYDTPADSGTALVGSFAHHTHLFWRGTDTDLQYSPGWKSIYARTLGDVAVASQTFTAHGERALVRLYHLGYTPPAQNEHPFLVSFELHACTQQQLESGGNISDPMTWAYSGTSSQTMACPMTNPTSLTYTPLPPFNPTLLRQYNVASSATLSSPLFNGGVAATMVDVNGDGVADLIAAASAIGTENAVRPFALGVIDGASGGQLVSTGYNSEKTGPLWAQYPDFLPSTHTALGNWVGDGQVNWLWFDQIPYYTDPAPVVSPGPPGTYETYSFSGSGFTHFGPMPVSPGGAYPSPCPAPFICGPDTSPNGMVGGLEEIAEMNWQRGKSFDVDGDGFMDMALIHDPNSTMPNQTTYFTHQGKDGTIIPYLRQTSQPVLVGYTPTNFHAFADMDADGLADVIELTKVGPTSDGFDGIVLTWWKNRGDGRFGSGQNGGTPTTTGMLAFGGVDATNQTVDAQLSNIAITDVTGDGLADLLALRSGTLYLYVQPPRAAFNNAFGFIPTGSIPNAAADDNAAISTADVDGSGFPSVVVTEGPNVSIYQLYPTVPAPGLLSTIKNPHQLLTQVQYQSVAQLEATAAPAWQTKLPAPTQVVVDVRSSGQFLEPDGTQDAYENKYKYTDPMYDARDRAFIGFRVVESDPVGMTAADPQVNTVTTYVPATCPGVTPGNPCTTGIDYGWRIRRGLPFSVQVSDASSGALLTTTVTEWTYEGMFGGMDGRAVRMVYAMQSDTYEGEPSAASISVTANGLIDTDPLSDGQWSWSGTAPIPGASVDHRVSQARDSVGGNQTSAAAWGAVGTNDVPVVTLTTWQVAPGDATNWLYRPTKTVVGAGDTVTATTLTRGGREMDYSYNQLGQLLNVSSPLSQTISLARSNPGGSPAPPPANASVNSATGTTLTLAQYQYDAFGNVDIIQRPDGRCAGITYDTLYHELPIAKNAYRSGCGNNPLTTTLLWDRGLQKVTRAIDPGTALTAWTYDAYGRLTEIDQPSTQTLGATSSAALRLDWSNVDAGNAAGYALHSTTLTHDSYIFFDNFGRQRYRMSQAETAGYWIVSGGIQLTPSGRVENAFVPFDWPALDPTQALTEGVPFNLNNFSTYTYDALGRPLVVTGPDGATVASMTYHPLRTDIADGEQIAGGLHAGSYTELVVDGRGAPMKTTAYLVKDPIDQISTSVTRLATGEITTVTRSHTAASDSYTRSMQYDSLGRLVYNQEPNTSKQIGTTGTYNAWRYAYDDAGDLVGTSDARGCGKNLVYDALGRLTNEDYSPCLASQGPYTSAYETSFTYDTPVLASAPTGDYAGKLTGAADRAAQTLITYDFRGRASSVQRQLAVPDSTGPTGYAPHWFQRAITYDDANRIFTSTSGADPDVFGFTETPYLENHYSARGTLASIDGSYGTLLASISFNPDGTVRQEVLGDVAETTADYTYWLSGRLKTSHVHRPSGPWTTGAGYVPPSSTVPTTLEDDLSNVLIEYDNAGHPLLVGDNSSAGWPTGALPASRNMTYDDNYRVRTISTGYGPTGLAGDSFAYPPFAPELAAGTDLFPPGAPGIASRVRTQSITYDWQGNTSSSYDDQNAFADRSLGVISNATQGAGPNQLTSAVLGGNTVSASYDASGNLLTLSVVRPAPCTQECNTQYQYTWDEVGNLSSATRVYIEHGLIQRSVTSVAEYYTYDSSGHRVLKETDAPNGTTTYAADVYDSLRLEATTFPDANGDYVRTSETENVILSSAGMRLGRVLYSSTDPAVGSSSTATQPTAHVLLELGDHLGSTSFVIDQATSELVEHATYQGYGAPESDFRTSRWSNFREPIRYTGHEDDSEVGLVYFGHRYYSPILSRWTSPDPLTIHALGSDLNPYAFVTGSPLSLVDPTGLDGCDAKVSSCPQPPQPAQPTCDPSSSCCDPITCGGPLGGGYTPPSGGGSPPPGSTEPMPSGELTQLAAVKRTQDLARTEGAAWERNATQPTSERYWDVPPPIQYHQVWGSEGPDNIPRYQQDIVLPHTQGYMVPHPDRTDLAIKAAPVVLAIVTAGAEGVVFVSEGLASGVVEDVAADGPTIGHIRDLPTTGGDIFRGTGLDGVALRAANQDWLDWIVANNLPVNLATPIENLVEGRTYIEEFMYLLRRGYTVNPERTMLLPPQ